MHKTLLASLLIFSVGSSALAQEPRPPVVLDHPIMACTLPNALVVYLHPDDWRRNFPNWQQYQVHESGCSTLPAGTHVTPVTNQDMLSQVTYPTANGQSPPVYVATIELGPPR